MVLANKPALNKNERLYLRYKSEYILQFFDKNKNNLYI
jgi:hypothetical protein